MPVVGALAWLAAVGAMLSAGSTARAADFHATVTLDGVQYTLPTKFKDHALQPRQPLCHTFEYETMVVIGRELFINGDLVYRAKPGDDVVVIYEKGVQVNGQPAAPPQPAQVQQVLCGPGDFQ